MVKFFVKTFGCSLNQSDSEYMTGVLENEGFIWVDSLQECDVAIINSCTVKNLAQTKLFRQIKEAESSGKKIVLAGCVPDAEKSYLDTAFRKYVVIGTKNLSDIGQAVIDAYNGECTKFLGEDKKKVLNLPKVRVNHSIEIIPISEGCLGDCSYCKTRMARGALQSYHLEDVKKTAKKAVDEGVKFLWITSQDTGAYGKDIDSNIIELLDELIKIEGDFKIRLGMCNPNFAKQHLDGLAEIFKSDKMFGFIHLPFQSGSDKVLKDMNRFYSEKDILEISEKLKKEIPKISIATDIIVGYPTESDKDFEDTKKVIETVKPDVINVSRFWKRPGTRAFGLKPITSNIVMKRTKELNDLSRRIVLENKKKYLNKTLTAYVEDGDDKKGYVCRTDNYLQVVLNEKGLRPGQKIKVKVKEATVWYLKGEILN